MTDLPMQLRVARAIMRTEYPDDVDADGSLTELGEIFWDRRGDWYLSAAKAVLEEVRQPTPQMINAGEAWRGHCSDTDSLWTEMVQAAIYPEDYPAELPPAYAGA